ncbi:MAG: hypothetical protein ACXWBM_04360 [Chthoniobacterales bacterium]
MAANETEISFEQPRSGFGAWLGIVLLFLVFALFVWAVMGIVPHADNYEKKRADARMEKLKTVHDEADKALHGYAWVDKSKGVVRLPIERAMEVTLADLAQKKPTVAYPIPPPAADQTSAQTTAPNAPPPATATTPAPSPAGSLPKATMSEGKNSEARGQPAGAANPPNAAPASQPGASATPAASPPAPASQARPNPSAPTATPVQSPVGSPIPGKTP